MAIQLNPPPPRHKFRWHDWDLITGCGMDLATPPSNIGICILGSKKPDVTMHFPWKKKNGSSTGVNFILRFPANCTRLSWKKPSPTSSSTLTTTPSGALTTSILEESKTAPVRMDIEIDIDMRVSLYYKKMLVRRK